MCASAPPPPGERAAAGLDHAPNPLIDGYEMFRVEATNTSGESLWVARDSSGSRVKGYGWLECETRAGWGGGEWRYAGPIMGGLKRLGGFTGPGQHQPTWGMVEWPAGETVVAELPLQQGIGAGRHEARAAFEYTFTQRRGEWFRVVSPPVRFAVTPLHLAEAAWRKR